VICVPWWGLMLIVWISAAMGYFLAALMASSRWDEDDEDHQDLS
jgi:hypothetical protein